MRVVTNPGSNLSAEALARYGVEVTAQQIVVDGVAHDTRMPLPLAQVDAWVRRAKEFPHVVGTTAPEFAECFARLLRDDKELVAVMSSKKIIGSWSGATTAARTVLAAPQFKGARIVVVDARMTDAGAGLVTIAAGEAARARIPLELAEKTLEAMAERGRFAFVPATLDALVKSGRASFLRGWLANLLQVKPLIAFVDGELKSVGRIPSKSDGGAAVLEDALANVGSTRKVWCAVIHGDDPERADELARAVRKRLNVEFLFVRPLSASIYLNTGRGSIGLATLPVDDLPWTLPRPPEL